jgi:glycerophosphoryl diester phosphodiesterase
MPTRVVHPHPYFPRIVAHRGLHDKAPENSLAAFEEACHIGINSVECDVWPTSDGAAVVIHDETLDRTTTGKGLVWWHRWDDLRHLHLRRGDGTVDESSFVPALGELANRPVGYLLVEIKPPNSPAFVREVIRVLSNRRRRERWMIQSFDEANLVHALTFDPKLPAAFLVEDLDALARGVAHGWKTIYMRHSLLDEATATRLHGKGITIGVWTPNTDADLQRVIDLRAAVIITDDPVRASMHVGST